MRITIKMKRELKSSVNQLEELLIIIKQYFPKLTVWIDNLTDTRNQSYITYDFKICLLTQILAFCSSYQSMNKIGRDFNSDIVIANINHILKTNYIELPHKDTLINVISEIKFEELEKIQTNIIRTLIRSKMLDKYRFNDFFHVVIDGTGLYSTRINLGEQAITKVYNKYEENEYTLYSYYALEAKLVCGNMTFSLATEFVKNENDLNDAIYCINCNHKINKNYRYCSYCGNYVATNIKSNNIITHNNDINYKNSDDDKNISIISLLIFFFIFLPQIFVYIYAFSNSTGAADGTGFVVIFNAVLAGIPTIVSFYLGVIAVKRYKFIVKKRVVSDVRKKLNFFNIISLFLMAPFVFIYSLLFIIIFMCSFIF